MFWTESCRTEKCSIMPDGHSVKFMSFSSVCERLSCLSQVSQRFYNSHALLNMAVYLPAASDNVVAGVRVAVGHFDTTDMGETAYALALVTRLLVSSWPRRRLNVMASHQIGFR